MNIEDRIPLKATGRVRVYAVEDMDQLDSAEPVVDSGNVVCVGFYDCLQNLLMRNFEDWQPTSITVGYGGDYDQPADPDATPPTDQGERVAPLFTDTYVRKSITSIPIVQVLEGDIITERRFTYVAIARPYEAVTSDSTPTKPFINEFGLKAYNDTLLAHYVTPADDDDRAERFQKSSVTWMVIKWEIKFSEVE